ncbi:unnamed protein product [Cylindrotheca closterium]|uniref:Uncharacterized protein n=1 Tax=Cylindrotheca closterium TaxID=2856 RepID=A0AAD2GCL8_9STRA|nr:unnamed protein product [Cylindrotheca closterium]
MPHSPTLRKPCSWLLQQMLAAQAAAPIAVPAAAAPPAVAVPPTPILDSFDDATPFDISSRQGSKAGAQASAPLTTPWSGHSISLATLQAAHTARNDPRAIQNSRCLYNCLASSITGDLRIEIFGQPGNLLTHGNGPSLFKRKIATTAAASLQVSSNAIQDLMNLEPADSKFDMTAVNSKIIGLFTLASTAA